MRSIPLAMIWETFRRGKWDLLIGLLGGNALTLLLLTALRREAILEADDPALLVMQTTLFQINMFAFGATVLSAQGPASRLYTYPIQTSSLVACHMLLAATLVALEVVVSTLAINALFDLEWPLWGPALFAATAIVTTQAIFWFTEKTAWLPWSVCLAAAVFGLWLKSHYGPTFSMPTHPWSEISPWEVAVLTVVAALAYWVGTIGVARNRCGEKLGTLGVVAFIGRVFDRDFDERLSFGTPAQAQFWFEWTKKGWAMPGMVVMCLVLGVGTWLTFVRDPEDLVVAFVVAGSLLSVLAGIGGVIFGNSGSNDTNYQMGHFLGTRPMTTVEMSRTILKAGALSVLMAWTIWFLAFACLFGILFLTNTIPDPVFPAGVHWWYLPATLLGFWTAFALVTSGALMGHMKWWGPIFVGFIAAGMSLLVFSSFALTPDTQRQLFQGVLTVGGIVFVLGTIWAYVKAYRISLVNGSVVGAAAMVSCLLIGVVLYEWIQNPVASFPVYLFTIGLMTAAVAPFATAPLALTWNRNQ
jgi:hypothetical protein